MPQRRAADTEPMDRILLWAVKLHGQWRFVSTELSPDRHRGWPLHPSQRNWGCSTLIKEREVSWSWTGSRTGPSRWRGCNHRSHDNLQQDLAEGRMANPMDPVLSHHTSQERHIYKKLTILYCYQAKRDHKVHAGYKGAATDSRRGVWGRAAASQGEVGRWAGTDSLGLLRVAATSLTYSRLQAGTFSHSEEMISCRVEHSSDITPTEKKDREFPAVKKKKKRKKKIP